MSTVCYFEIPVNDMDRAQSFYQDLFNWQFEKMPGSPAEVDYWMIKMGEECSPGPMGGGMMKRQHPQHPVTNYVGVENLDNKLAQAKELGATVLVPKSPVTGMGYFAICQDPEGNTFGLWQCDESATA